MNIKGFLLFTLFVGSGASCVIYAIPAMVTSSMCDEEAEELGSRSEAIMEGSSCILYWPMDPIATKFFENGGFLLWIYMILYPVFLIMHYEKKLENKKKEK